MSICIRLKTSAPLSYSVHGHYTICLWPLWLILNPSRKSIVSLIQATWNKIFLDHQLWIQILYKGKWPHLHISTHLRQSVYLSMKIWSELSYKNHNFHCSLRWIKGKSVPTPCGKCTWGVKWGHYKVQCVQVSVKMNDLHCRYSRVIVYSTTLQMHKYFKDPKRKIIIIYSPSYRSNLIWIFYRMKVQSECQRSPKTLPYRFDFTLG